MRTILPWLLAAAFLIALPGMTTAFGSDEVWSLNAVSGSHARMIGILRADIHPPLFYELLFAWVRAFGSSEIAVRALSVGLLLLGVCALYLWASELLGAPAAAIAASIYFSSPLAVVASRLGRMYTLLSLVSILSTYLYWKVFVERNTRPRHAALLVTVNVLGSFTHVWFFFLLFAQGVHWLWFVRRRVLFYAAAMGSSLLPYALVWLPGLLRQMRTSQEALAWMTPPGREEITNTLFLYTGPVLVLAPFLLWAAVRQRLVPPAWTRGLSVMLAVALAVPFAISYFKPVFYPRFTVIGLHLFAVLVAACAPRLRAWQVPVLVSILGGAIALNTALHKQCDSRWGAAFLERQASPGDTVIFSSLSRLPVDHYLQRKVSVTEVSFPAEIDAHPGYEGNLSDPRRVQAMEAEAGSLIRSLRERHAKVFFFHGFRPEVDQILEKCLESEFKAVRTQSVKCGGMGCYYDAVTVYE